MCACWQTRWRSCTAQRGGRAAQANICRAYGRANARPRERPAARTLVPLPHAPSATCMGMTFLAGVRSALLSIAIILLLLKPERQCARWQDFFVGEYTCSKKNVNYSCVYRCMGHRSSDTALRVPCVRLPRRAGVFAHRRTLHIYLGRPRSHRTRGAITKGINTYTYVQLQVLVYLFPWITVHAPPDHGRRALHYEIVGSDQLGGRGRRNLSTWATLRVVTSKNLPCKSLQLN